LRFGQWNEILHAAFSGFGAHINDMVGD